MDRLVCCLVTSSLEQLLLQLGHGDRLKRTRPVQIATLADKNVVSVVCGQYHCLALDGDQRCVLCVWHVCKEKTCECVNVNMSVCV